MVPNGWEVKKLEELATKISDGIHSTPKYTDNSQIYFINGNNLKDGSIVITEKTKEVCPVNATQHRRDLSNRTILMSINGTIGNLAFYNNENVVLGKSACYINVAKGVDVNYIYYMLNDSRTQAFYTSELTGSTIKNLSLKTIKSTKVLTPPLPEQQKIAKILTTWDKAIDTTERLIDNSKQQKKALMQQLLTGKKRLLDDKGKRLEGEWDEHQLKEVAEIIVSPVDKKIVEGEIPVELCNYTDVYYNIRITKSLDFMKATAKQSEIDRFTLQVDDVIITKDSETPEDIAVPALVSEDLNGVVCGYHLAIIRPNQDKVRGAFLNYLFATPKIGYYFFSLANGATRFGLTIGSIEKAQFKLPSLAEQQKIAAVLTNADKEIELLEQQLADLQQEKKALMQVLLTGKKRVVVDGEIM
ncbi:restriction endonuclease subunit S [uncultured Psychrobacter sp.]|uniref:restriction endonuclease subunit S n=1 Tax=uncultured Psychrobacter sp. TaxID=259303 RepID=UPI0026283716|nr:restriction endonuclease subunit S [uncultured Psychrobacter sp.]